MGVPAPLRPIDAVPLFAPLHEELLALLRGLQPEDWARPTVCAGWAVRDLAAHLLDGDIRRLSITRDGWMPPAPDKQIANYGDLVAFLNGLNAQWVSASRRISPRMLTDLLALTGPQVSAYFQALDPEGPAAFPVAWAGETESKNWFDIAREYTERWHHQQQIREAVGAPGLIARRWLHPVLDTFLRALPHSYRDTAAPMGTQVAVSITGDAGGDWLLVRREGYWQLAAGEAEAPASRIRTDADTAWRLFTKGLPRLTAAPRVEITGNQTLGEVFLSALAIMG